MANKTYPKANFIQMVTYWQEHTDFEKLEADKMTDVYFEGMKYYAQIAGKAKKTDLFPQDIELLLLFSNEKHVTIEELSEMSEHNTMALNRLVHKLIVRGYVSSYKEKTKKYYRLTPIGRQRVLEEILGEDLLSEERD